MNFLDCYIDDPSAISEGHAFDQIYARVPVLDDKDKFVTYLCRVTEDQYRHWSTEGILETWATKTKAKKKIKDKEGKDKDKDIPTIVFGGTLYSPGSPVIIPDDSVQVGLAIPEPEPLPPVDVFP